MTNSFFSDKISEADILEALKHIEAGRIKCGCGNGRSGAVFGGLKPINKPSRGLVYQKCKTCNGKRYIVPKDELNVSLIAAMSKNRVIGKNNELIWDIPEDMKWFREKTKGKPVIMGRKTHESIGRLLPKRKNIIITRKLDYSVKDAIVVNSIEKAILECRNAPEIMVIGGGEIYKAALPFVNKIYLTIICKEFDGDTYFPKFDGEDWLEIDVWDGIDSTEELPYSFSILERK